MSSYIKGTDTLLDRLRYILTNFGFLTYYKMYMYIIHAV